MITLRRKKIKIKDNENKLITDILPNTEIWLGIQNKYNREKFLTTQNKELYYTNWNQSAYQSQQEECGVVLNTITGKWTGIKVSEKKNVICEIQSKSRHLFFKWTRFQLYLCVINKLIQEFCVRLESGDNCQTGNSSGSEIRLFHNNIEQTSIKDFKVYDFCLPLNQVNIENDTFKLQIVGSQSVSITICLDSELRIYCF